MKILVTGSSGMIGTAMCEKLKKVGHTVFCVDKKQPKYFLQERFLLCDLRDRNSTEDLLDSVGKVDLVVHLAANARVFNLVETPQLALDNMVITHNVYEYVRRAGIRLVIFASSRETYGNGNQLPVSEQVASHRKTESVYTASKIMGESYAYAYNKCYGVETRIVRYSNVYGAYDESDRFIPKAIEKLSQNAPFEIYGEGKTLGFTHLDDAVDGTLKLIQSSTHWGDLGVDEYNIASDTQDSLFDVANRLKNLMGSSSSILVSENKVGEVMNFQADISKIKSLGWTPSVNTEDGLKLAVAWYKNYGKN